MLYVQPSVCYKEVFILRPNTLVNAMHLIPLFSSGVFRTWRRFMCAVAGMAITATSATAQVVTFPDSGLEDAVRNALQIQAPTNIYVTNMLTLTNLDAGYRGIQNLGGLQTATNLSVLDLNGNPLSDFTALTGATSLVEFKAANCQLQSLSGVATAKSVKLLEINSNSLTNLSGLAGMTNLLRLYASGNPLVDLSGVAAAANLTNLDVGFCQVTNISAITSLWHLVQFQAPWNHFWDATPLAGLTNMIYLDIGGNRGPADVSITNASFLTGMKNIRWLSLYYLRVADLAPLTTLTTLTNLDVSWNNGPANPSVLNGLTNLTFLHATADNLSNIVFVTHMPQLKDLEVGYNSITDLSPALGHSLTSLLVYYNPITNASLVSNFPSLTRLSIGGVSGLTTLSSLTGLTNLVELWVDGNPGLGSLTPILSLTNIHHLSVNSTALTNLPAVTALYKMEYLEMNSLASAPDLSFLGQLTNLNALDIGGDNIGDISALATLPYLSTIYMGDNVLSDISPLLSIPGLQYGGYVDIRRNLLDVGPTTPAWNVITNLQEQYVNVDYDPQNTSQTIDVWVSPSDQCITNLGSAYFAVSASTTAGELRYQWQRNGTDLPGQTSAVLFLSNVQTNQAGQYRAILADDNGKVSSSVAHLYVGDPYCGRTVFITRQPLNMVAAPDEDVYFTVEAFTTLGNTNLNFQWQFNGTDIGGETAAELYLSQVDTNAVGTYRVLVWDANSNVVASVGAQLSVVDVVPFVDPGFSNLVYAALVDQGHTPSGGEIHLTDLDYLNYLFLNGAGISNISGLQYSRQLYSLDLGNNPISDPGPLASLNNLNYLYISGAGLQDASFVSRLYNLQELYLNENSIHTIPVMDGLNNLSVLEINNNGCVINTPRLAGLTNLYRLNLHSDCLPDIAFCAGMQLLQFLDVGGDWQYDEHRNQIQDISPLLGKSALYWLSLSWDEVTNVPIVGTFTNLQSLFLSSNHFDNITFITNLPGLQEFSINFSSVTNISYLTNHTLLYNLDVSTIATSNLTAVAGLTNLTTLWCGGNRAGGGGAYVAALKNLTVLGCDMNGVSSLAPFAGLTNLYYLNLENNVITNVGIFAGRTNLQNLYLSGNKISDLSPLSGLTNLTFLSLSGNGFTNIAPVAGLYKLQWLVMQSNHVQTISAVAGLTNLVYALDIAGNEISDASPVTNLHSLTYLSLWQNNLKTLPAMSNLPLLNGLDLWGNQLTNASGVSDMPNLTWLGLSRNNFSVAPTLLGLPQLQTLELNTNHITDLSGLAGLTSLRWLNLNENNLQSISPVVGLTQLYYLDVRNNLLNINEGSAVRADIAVIQSHNTFVDYMPQKSLFLLSPLRLSPSQFQFSIQGSAGSTLRIWSSIDLTSWTSLGFLTNTNGTATFIDVNATNKVKSYRAEQL